jgi:hypothetical protein
MTPDMIEKFLHTKGKRDSFVNIHFKERRTITGLFIQGNDYNELKSKNFWRVVNHTHIEEWNQTRNPELAKIFNGLSFTRLSEEKSEK